MIKHNVYLKNCFQLIDGPDAPDIKVIELDGKFIFQISNPENSNNYLEQYVDQDPFIVCPTEEPDCDLMYRFQGYQVFQLKDNTVSVTDIHNPEMARLIYQCDINDGVSQIVNYEWDDQLGANIPVEEVNGKNEGINHSFVITDDYFATSSRQLVNYKKYYYVAIAYAHNDYLTYDQNDPLTINGQKKPYLASRKSASGAILVQEAIPHPLTSLNGGTTILSDYGDGPEITRREGWGNAYNSIELTDESINTIMNGEPWKDETPTYKRGHGPVNIKVIDPLNIPNAEFLLEFIPDSVNYIANHFNRDSTNIITTGLILDTKWMLLKRDKGSNDFMDTVFSEGWIRYENEQIIPQWGISVGIDQVQFPGGSSAYPFQLSNGTILKSINNGFIEASMTYDDPAKPWLDFFRDEEGISPLNWIRAGTQAGGLDERDHPGKDPEAVYETIIQGKWAPYSIASKASYGLVNPTPAFEDITFQKYRLNSVDVVITADKSKWTRCPVIEMAEDNVLSENRANRFELRKSPSVDKDGNYAEKGASATNDPNDPAFIGATGMGWFPGYAIDVSNGERLNLMFGEDSWLIGQNGRDMQFNPTADVYDVLYYASGGAQGVPLFGGKHYIYVVGHNIKYDFSNDTVLTLMNAYDDGEMLYNMLNSGDAGQIMNAWQNPMWCAIPYTNPNFDFLSTDITIKLRTANPYFKNLGDFGLDTAVTQNANYPAYSFDLSEIAALINEADVLENSLEKINIVPNPYKGYSDYEGSQLENLVKITNLPQKCTISIYTINGTLVRRFDKDNNLAFVDWDLKNNYGISIASGVYIIHIKAEGSGERILKWFGSLRPIDLNSF